MINDIKKIVIIGPESTGKSTLSEQLANHYKTLWVPEFAREYLLKNGKEYTYTDLLTIAKGQLDLEELLAQKVYERKINKENTEPPSSYLFIDTDMYVMKVWCEFVFNKCHQWILDRVEERKYDFYLLCNTDLPWTKDELREYPDLETRQKLFNIYRDILTNQSIPWAEVSGTNEQRLQVAVKEIDDYFGK
ncbi:MAG TPA: ATP-binding protein [Chitinophagaceae bacterium]